MKTWIHKLDKNLHKLETFFAIASGALVIVVMLLIVSDVFLRYFFNSPLPGTLELVQFLFVGVVFLGVAYVQAIKGHIFIEIGGGKLSPLAARLLALFGHVFSIFIVAIMAWRTGIDLWRTFEAKDYSMGIIHFPIWPSKFALTFGLVLLLVRLAVDFVKTLAIGTIEQSENEGDGQHGTVG